LEISIGLEVDASGVVSLGASAEGAGVWGADWWKISNTASVRTQIKLARTCQNVLESKFYVG